LYLFCCVLHCCQKTSRILSDRTIFFIVQEVYLMKISARNILKGKIIKIDRGAVNAEVILELPGGIQVVSIITISSVDSLGLTEGKEAYAVVKASSVMIAVD
jgi:molybdopterin-binding protein